MTLFSNSFDRIKLYSGSIIRYTKPQPGNVSVASRSANLEAMDFGNRQDVLDYLGISTEE